MLYDTAWHIYQRFWDQLLEAGELQYINDSPLHPMSFCFMHLSFSTYLFYPCPCPFCPSCLPSYLQMYRSVFCFITWDNLNKPPSLSYIYHILSPTAIYNRPTFLLLFAFLHLHIRFFSRWFLFDSFHLCETAIFPFLLVSRIPVTHLSFIIINIIRQLFLECCSCYHILELYIHTRINKNHIINNTWWLNRMISVLD